MIYVKTEMNEMPKNCNECKLTCSFAVSCSLPFDSRTNAMKFRKSCMKKRHPDCPLVESGSDKNT